MFPIKCCARLNKSLDRCPAEGFPSAIFRRRCHGGSSDTPGQRLFESAIQKTPDLGRSRFLGVQLAKLLRVAIGSFITASILNCHFARASDSAVPSVGLAAESGQAIVVAQNQQWQLYQQ